jgi:hypothetical protein
VNQQGDLLLEGEAWVLPSPARIEYTVPRPERRATPVALLPATFAVEMMSIWMTSSVAMARQAIRLMSLAPGSGRADRVPIGEPNPIRP